MPLESKHIKNILDLNYQKYLQYKIVTIIFLFTYLVGIVIALLTKQLKFTDYLDILFLVALTIIVIGTAIPLVKRFNYHLRRIPKIIEKLN